MFQNCNNSSLHRHIVCCFLGYSSVQPPNLEIDFIKYITLKMQVSAHKVLSSDLLLSPPLLVIARLNFVIHRQSFSKEYGVVRETSAGGVRKLITQHSPQQKSTHSAQPNPNFFFPFRSVKPEGSSEDHTANLPT